MNEVKRAGRGGPATRTAGAVLLAALLAGCQGGPTPRAETAAAPETGGGGEPQRASAAATAATSISPDVLYRLLVAEFAGRRGQLGLAVSSYLAVARETRDPAVAERAVRVAVYARDSQRALEAAQLWAEIDPGSRDARQVYATLLVRAGRAEEAVAEFEALLEGAGEQRGVALRRIGDMLAREKDRDAAVAVMARLVERHAGEAQAHHAFARLLARVERLDEAASELERTLTLQPDEEQAVILYARVLQRQQRSAAAIAALGRFVEANPEAYSARVAYARLLVDAKRYEEARAEFKRLVEAKPDNADSRYALALLMLETGQPEQAEPHFRRLAEGRTRRDDARFYLGQILEGRKRREEALAEYRRVEGGEHRLDARIRAAALISELGDLDGARAYLRGYSARSPAEAARIHRAEAELLVRAERYAEAMAVYDAAIEQFPRNNDLLYARAMLAERMDRIDQLERDLRAILAREPDNADALNALGYTLADRTERLEEAYALIERALALEPDNYYIIDSMGWVMYRMGRYPEALRYLRRARELSDDAEIAAHLGEVLWVTGQREEARRLWNTALDSQPDHKALREVIERFVR